MSVIRIRDLKKDYNLGSIAIKALQGVSLDFAKGDFAAIAGPSGSGKSTLLHLAGCLDRPTSGKVEINGLDTAGMNQRQLAMLRRDTIGFIFQAYNLIPVLTALENVSFPLILLGLSPGEAREKSERVLAQVGLSGLEGRRPSGMSGGQQQRVAIARALVKRPAVILADEPTANLDSKTGRDILDIMLMLNREESITFVFSTHDPLVMEYAGRLITLRDGLVEKEESR